MMEDKIFAFAIIGCGAIARILWQPRSVDPESLAQRPPNSLYHNLREMRKKAGIVGFVVLQ